MAYLWLENDHRSNEEHIRRWDAQGAPLVTRTRQHIIPSPHIEEYLRQTGFFEVSQIGRYKIDRHIVTALVERWRSETHTFHFRTGECTITLEDVYMLLGLPFCGPFVTAPPNLAWNICAQLLGITPPANKTDGFTLSLSWLKDNLVDNNFSEQSPPEVKIQHTRRYLLYLFGGFLFPNTTGLFVHNSWLYLLMDFNLTRNYSWGSAVLTYLYRGLCEASHPNIKALTGCHFLLQVWGYCRLSYIAPKNDNPLQWPLGLK
ncbi:protein MAIN-LIKE 2-like [Medicago truncatula]|uniref:protein MAIN-LIKE 2-like n=1 Tax=Medicago truncatula TaxID=3880 RepID=UPI0019687393|nr:protein MAIN-LIKE 2-like [Medicago truncatula]